ncbi:o-succinylbenzoate synthase [bacterium]|nr:o-succinylbenzoate synthase [bacterium]
MTISNFKYTPFSLKLNIPFQSSSQTITERNGFIIMVTDELGNRSFGECSPLPGFSSETIEDAERILKGLQHQIIGFSIEENITAISELLSEFTLVPSLQFALEQAMISLLCKRNSNFLSNNLKNTKSEIDVNAVIGFGDEENILNRIRNKFKNGYRTFKIKVGRDDFELDYNLIKNIQTEFGSTINIRLDANRKWNCEIVEEYLERLSQYNVEYIEEPCNSLGSNLQLAQSSIVPIALDESISSFDDAVKVLNESIINFLILKPMICGGIISSLRIIRDAERMEKNVIISSSFESALGKSALVLLAASTNHSFAHGLDTSENFYKNICTDSYEVSNGKIVFDCKNYPPQFDFVLP